MGEEEGGGGGEVEGGVREGGVFVRGGKKVRLPQTINPSTEGTDELKGDQVGHADRLAPAEKGDLPLLT